MAETLIETMSAAWQPHKYRDEYRDALMEIIERKAQNEEIADAIAGSTGHKRGRVGESYPREYQPKAGSKATA